MRRGDSTDPLPLILARDRVSDAPGNAKGRDPSEPIQDKDLTLVFVAFPPRQPCAIPGCGTFESRGGVR